MSTTMKSKTKADLFDYIVEGLRDGLDMSYENLKAAGVTRPMAQAVLGPAIKATHYPLLFDELRSRVNKFGHKIGQRILRCTNQHEVEMALKGHFIKPDMHERPDIKGNLSKACQGVNDVILEIKDCETRENLSKALEVMEGVILNSLS